MVPNEFTGKPTAQVAIKRISDLGGSMAITFSVKGGDGSTTVTLDSDATYHDFASRVLELVHIVPVVADGNQQEAWTRIVQQMKR